MSPADQPQAIDWRRSTDPPTLWLSLALGSVLLHLMFFIVVSVVLTRTAKVQLEVEPIAVEFVDPKADTVQARSAAPSRTITARPSAPSSSTPSSAQAQPSAPRSQPSDFNQTVAQPFKPQPVRPRRVPLRSQPQQPNPLRDSVPQQPNPTSAPSQPQATPFPEQPNAPNSSQPTPNTDRSPGGLTGSVSSPTPQSTGTESPAESGTQIRQSPQEKNVMVAVSNPRQTSDFQKQPARPLDWQKKVSILCPPTLASCNIHLQVSLFIDQNGAVLDVIEASSESANDQETLKNIAKQIFSQWRFEPAKDAPDGKPLMPSPSNLIIDAQVQLP